MSLDGRRARRLARLRRNLALPTWRFVLRFGVLGFGVPMMVLMGSWAVWQGEHLSLPVLVLCFAVCGAVFGLTLRLSLVRERWKLEAEAREPAG